MRLERRNAQRIWHIEPGEFAPDREDATAQLMLDDLRMWRVSHRQIGEALNVHMDTVRGWANLRATPRGPFYMALRALWSEAKRHWEAQ